MKSDIEFTSNLEREVSPVLSYEDYRILCDGADLNIYRKTGVGTKEGYEGALQDSRSVFIELGGRRLPLFVPVEHAGGYDLASCQRLTASEEVYALALPSDLLADARVDTGHLVRGLGEHAVIIVESEPAKTAAIKHRLAAETDWKAGDFIDPRCPEGSQTAAVALYSSHFDSLDEDGRSLPFQERSYAELFAEDREATGDKNTELITPAMLRKDEELFEQLWQLHDKKFDWLGQYHPVSMQENKEFFRYIVTEAGTKSFVRFKTDEDGKRIPVCHGGSMDDIEKIDWINSHAVHLMKEKAAANGEKIQFFYGITSKSSPDKMIHYAKDVMGLVSRLAKRSGGRFNFVFESTNLSSLYIPRLVKEYIGEEHRGLTMFGEAEQESKLDYWFLSKSKETV